MRCLSDIGGSTGIILVLIFYRHSFSSYHAFPCDSIELENKIRPST
jgi:hypothetical protein